jgi:hypothetical protein
MFFHDEEQGFARGKEHLLSGGKVRHAVLFTVLIEALIHHSS